MAIDANEAVRVDNLERQIVGVNHALMALETKLSVRVAELEKYRALPASTPAAPTPAPETPDEIATRLLGDPETLAAVLGAMGGMMTTLHKDALYDEMRRLDLRWCGVGTRVLAATIAAGSFAK